MATTTKLNYRHEKMKRELIGLATGAVLCLTGFAFLFNQTLSDEPELPTTLVDNGVDDYAEKLENEKLAEKSAKPDQLEASSPASSVHDNVLAMATQASEVKQALENLGLEGDKSPLALQDIMQAPNVQLISVNFDESTPEKKPIKQVEQKNNIDNSVISDEVVISQQEVLDNTGWIYAGQFVNGRWSEQGLKIGNELPESGKQYSLNWGATVRDNPPGRRKGLGKPISNLSSGREIEILQVKKSGSKGHIWLEIKL